VWLVCALPVFALPRITVDTLNTIPPLDPNASQATWSRAAGVTLAWDLQAGRAMNEATTARIATDGRFLLVRFDAVQRERVFQTQRTNDVGQGTDDNVWVDVWPSGPTGFEYQFIATPNGTHYQSSTENATYAPIWESYGAVRDGGYTVTMKIPLGVMRGAQSSTSWRVQFARYIRATGQQAVWSFDVAQTSADDPARAGTMSIAPSKLKRRQPRIAVYGLGEIASAGAAGNTWRMGLDLSVPIAEQSSFYATFHPDFSNVELDQQTISPTVFPRAFIEVRPFFTQGANNFNNFYCNFCNGFTALYTPAIPTPRSGYAVEGKSGPFSFTGFDSVGNGREDLASGIVYTSPDTRWNASFNRVTVNLPGFMDNENVAGLFYNDLKHVIVYANYGNDSGTNVLQGDRAQYYDSGATWSSQTFSIWGGVHRIGSSFNPADAFILKSGVNGWGIYANKIWPFASNARLAAISFGGALTRNHAGDGPFNQTNNKLDLDILTRSAVDLNLTSGSSYLLLSNGVFTPVSQNGIGLTYHSGLQTNNPVSFDAHGPSATPATMSYNTGRFGNGRLDTWIRSSTMRVGDRGTLTIQLDDTAQRFAAGGPNVQWFESAAYSYQIDRDSSLGIGARRVVGNAPVPNGGGNCSGVCSNLSLAYHTRLRHSEIYIAYGDPNALITVPQAIFKLILYAGSDKGT